MSLLTPDERRLAESLGALAHENPFAPERRARERAVLGGDFVEEQAVWSHRPARADQNPNVARIGDRAVALVEAVRGRLASGATATTADAALYEDAVLYALYHRHEAALYALIDVSPSASEAAGPWKAFRADAERLLAGGGITRPTVADVAHVFACFFQIRRAFHHIFWHILGGSPPAAALRAAVWQSIFTHDMRRYRRSLWDRLGDVTTLVVGPSGTGKELVARAIALSRYVPLDPTSGRFADDWQNQFHALNLSALSPTLIESELFGHRRGAFTGAVEDRTGWLEHCGPRGTVFLDEIGEVDGAIQVKLLRVLQTRGFERLGDTKPRRFQGKLIAATNRDLAVEISAGRFRRDFYYRLCADVVETPSLAAQLAAVPDELADLVLFLSRRIVGEDEAESVAAETVAWIERHLGPGYEWPGNVRELEQCVRNVLVRGAYRPARLANGDARAELARDVAAGRLGAEELLGRYATLVYADTGSYIETARRLGVDRRTVKARVDAKAIAAFRRGA
jgi:hypothetical protein